MTGASVPRDLSRHQFIDVPLGAASLAEAMWLRKQRRHDGYRQSSLRP